MELCWSAPGSVGVADEAARNFLRAGRPPDLVGGDMPQIFQIVKYLALRTCTSRKNTEKRVRTETCFPRTNNLVVYRDRVVQV